MTIEEVARVCHEANRAICENNGDFSQKVWTEAEDWQQLSAIRGVEFALDNPDATPKDQHDAWVRDKLADGWVYGLTKDASAKTHPCLVEYENLPVEQQQKDVVFRAIVHGLAPYIKSIDNAVKAA